MDLVLCAGGGDQNDVGARNKCSRLDGDKWVTSHILNRPRLNSSPHAMWKSSKGYAVLGGACCVYGDDGKSQSCGSCDEDQVELLDNEFGITKPFFNLTDTYRS